MAVPIPYEHEKMILPNPAWDQCGKEKDREYELFNCYRRLTEIRTFTKTALAYANQHKEDNKPVPMPAQIGIIARRWYWVDRVEAWDRHIRNEFDRAIITRRVHVAERHLEIAKRMGNIILARIIQIEENPSLLNIDQIKGWAETLVKIERLALGDATDILEDRADPTNLRNTLRQKLVEMKDRMEHAERLTGRIVGDDENGDGLAVAGRVVDTPQSLPAPAGIWHEGEDAPNYTLTTDEPSPHEATSLEDDDDA